MRNELKVRTLQALNNIPKGAAWGAPAAPFLQWKDE
jgi:hypothetical protein